MYFLFYLAVYLAAGPELLKLHVSKFNWMELNYCQYILEQILSLKKI
jgi:hypothetical protein